MTVSYDVLKVELEKQREVLRDEIAQFNTTANEGMGYSTHPADDGSVAFEQAANLAIRRNAERLLYQVERALFRIEEGTYGVCRECNTRIDAARLKAIPYTRYCLDCADKHEDNDI